METTTKKLTGVTIDLVVIRATTNAEGVGCGLDQGHKFLGSLASIRPAVRVHLSTLILWVLSPNGGIDAAGHLRVVGGLGVVGAGNVALGHGWSQGRGWTVAVHGRATLVRGHGRHTVPGQHGAELGPVLDRGDNVLGRVLGAGNRLVCQDR